MHACVHGSLPKNTCPKKLGKGALHQKGESVGCQPYQLQSLFSDLEDIAYISSALILSCQYTVISFSEIVNKN